MIPISSNRGGRAERYRETPGASERLWDPVSYAFLQFKTPLHADNWLTQRFRVGVKSIEVFNVPVAFAGGTRSAQPSLRVRLEQGTPELHVVVHYEGNRALIPAVRRMARAEGAVCVVRDDPTVRTNNTYLQDLDYLLHAASARADEVVDLGDAIVERLKSLQVDSVGDLRAAFSTHSQEVVDGALARLHTCGKGYINFGKEACYGNRSEFSLR